MPDITDQARQLLEASMAKRLQAVSTANEKALLRERLQQQLATAEAELDTAWKEALDAGWDERELKRLGLTKPGTKPRRPRPGSKPRGSEDGGAGSAVDQASTPHSGDEQTN